MQPCKVTIMIDRNPTKAKPNPLDLDTLVGIVKMNETGHTYPNNARRKILQKTGKVIGGLFSLHQQKKREETLNYL